MYFFALEFVLGGHVCGGSAMIAYLGVGRAVTFIYLVSEAVASRTLEERFGGDCDLRGDPFVVHVSLFFEKLTNC